MLKYIMQTKVHKMLSPTQPIPTSPYKYKEPSDKVYVVAGNVAQFNHYRNKKLLEGSSKQYYYVHSPESLRGLSRVHGVFIGTWKERNDIELIHLEIRNIKSKMAHQEALDKASAYIAQDIDQEILSKQVTATQAGNIGVGTGLTAIQTLASGSNGYIGSSATHLTEAAIRDMMKKYIDEVLKNPSTLGGI